MTLTIMDPHSISTITTLLLVFGSAIIGGIVAKRFKMPSLIGYIAAGVVFGNLMSGSVDSEFLSQIADAGVTLLLFTLGVEFSFHRLSRALGTVVWAAILQILCSLFIFVFVFLWLGFGFLPSLYIAVAVSLSSTAIVVKVLSERGELDTVPGELTTAWLVIQDLAVVPLMIILPTLTSLHASGNVTVLTILAAISVSLLKSMAVLGGIWYLGKRGIPKLLNFAAGLESREIFLLCTMGIVLVAAVAAYAFGLSAALGAFIAGLLISETSQNHAIFSEVRPLRDLFAVVFFVTLGLVLPIADVLGFLPLLLTVAAVVLLVKWFFVFGLTRYLGNHRKTAFFIALSLTTMSEFGFIIAREGLAHGALSRDRYVFLVALTFITMLSGTLMLSHAHSLYYWFYKTLGKYLPKLFTTKQELSPNREELSFKDHIVICGYGRVGKYIGRALEMASVPYVVVDYNHATIRDLKHKGIPVVYGDPADKDVLDYAQVDLARAMVVAIPDRHTQEMIIGNAHTLNRRIRIICRTHHEEDQKWLKSLGVSLVVQPEFEAALSVITKLLGEFGLSHEDIAGKVSRLKIEHGVG
jgi:CPA2 family monovalent cation:H+ antiporter-2